MKTKLLIIIKNFDGGISTFLNQLTNSHSSIYKNYEFSLLSLESKAKITLPEFEYISRFDSKNESRKRYKGLNFILIAEEYVWLRREILSVKPDAILAIDTHTSILTCLLKKFFFKKTKVIINSRNNVEAVSQEKLSFFVRILLRFLGRILFREADAFVCVSKGAAQDFKKFFRLKKTVTVIYNGIDLKRAQWFGKRSIAPGDGKVFLSGEKTIVSIGRLEKQKDFETLIRSIKLTQIKIKNIRLLIIGDGSERNKIQMLINELKLEKAVYLLGWRENVYSYLKKADLFVLSTNYEGFGYVLLEAMSQGVPIISSDSEYGPSEVLENGKYGFLVPVRNTSAMSKVITTLITNKFVYKKYSRKSSERVKFFSNQKMLMAYKELFIQITNK